MLPADRPLRLATHSGTFHADDCLAYAVLCGALGLEPGGDGHRLLRTRDRALLDQADIVWDVGGVADAAAWRFDHHQPGAPRAGNGDPLSSAGLVWRAPDPDAGPDAAPGTAAATPVATLGHRYVRRTLAASGHADAGDAAVERIVDGLRHKFVRHVDLVDNGVERAAPTDLCALVEAHNSGWDEPSQSDPEAFEARQFRGFLDATRLVAAALARQVERERGTAAAHGAVAQAWEDCVAGRSGIHPDVLELPRGMPWQRAATELALPILFVLSPEPDGRWKLQAMPAEKGGFRNRLDMPEAWRGLADAALEAASGVPGALFAHRGGHLAVASGRDAALALARLCLAGKLSPAEALRKAWGR